MEPVQITDGVLLCPDFHILQVQITLVAIALNHRFLLVVCSNDLLQRLVLNVGYDL